MTKSDLDGCRSVVELPARLDYSACERLADDFDKRRGQDVSIQAGSVSFLSAMAAEILLRARSEWQAANKGFVILSPSETFWEEVALLGIPKRALIEEAHE